MLRVSQLDATELDEELSVLLQDQFLSALASLPQTGILESLKPELRAMVRLLLWKYSLFSRGRSFGQEMMDLSYTTSEQGGGVLGLRHKMAFLFFSVLSEWLQDRLHLVSRYVVGIHPSVAEKWLTLFLTIVKSLSVLNFVAFLLGGRFPSLADRLLSLRMTPMHPQSIRPTSYDYMNREILWHGFYELVFSVLPHFNLFALKNWLRRTWSWGCGRTGPVLAAEDFSQCSFCEGTPTMPCVAGCGHLYCYYCIRANCLADSRYPCSTCGIVVSSWKPAVYKLDSS